MKRRCQPLFALAISYLSRQLRAGRSAACTVLTRCSALALKADYQNLDCVSFALPPASAVDHLLEIYKGGSGYADLLAASLS